jgi:hypothetical protein
MRAERDSWDKLKAEIKQSGKTAKAKVSKKIRTEDDPRQPKLSFAKAPQS